MNGNDWFSFEQSPWQIAVDKLPKGSTISAVRLLTLLEGEDEETVDEAFAALDAQSIALDITQLPKDYGSADTEKRLRLEEKLAASGIRSEHLPEGDPLALYLEEMAATPAFGDVTALAQELAACNAAGKTDSAVYAQLVNLCLSRVVALSKEFTGRGVLLLDLIQEGSLGLWNGMLAYTGETDFEALRDWWIRQYMARAVTVQARQSGVGMKMRKALEDYRDADKRLLTELGRNPTVEEIALELHVSAEDAQVYEDMLRNARALEKAKQPQKPSEPEDDQAVEDTAYFQSRQRILDMLSTLSELEAQVITMRFGLEGGVPATPQQVGAKLGLTAQEVTAMEAAALDKLRREG